MMDERRELRALAADLRAWLDDAKARGQTVEPFDVVAVSPVEAADTLESGAGRVAQLEGVRAEMGDCRRCALCRGRKNIVFGVGDPRADLVVVGEAPGYHEDQRGEPFVGPAGDMLNRMLTHVLGLDRSQVYIVNVVKCRPPDNRNPLPDEIASCAPFLVAQLEAIQPKVMLVLGAVAFQSLFAVREGIKRNRGRWRSYRGIPTMPTLHPAYLLRQPSDKRLVFDDLKAVRARFDATGGRRT